MIKKYALIKVIQKVLRETKEVTLREVARIAKVGPSTAKEALDFLYANNIVEKRVEGRNHLYRIKNTFLTRHIRILLSLSEINASGLVDELLKKNQDVISIILYGSVARGEDDAKSDIDLLIITRKKRRLETAISEQRLSRELTMIQYTYQEWKEKAEREKAFYSNVILHSIPLYGEKPVVS